MKTADQHETTFAAWLEEHGAILRQLSRVYAPEPADADELQQPAGVGKPGWSRLPLRSMRR